MNCAIVTVSSFSPSSGIMAFCCSVLALISFHRRVRACGILFRCSHALQKVNFRRGTRRQMPLCRYFCRMCTFRALLYKLCSFSPLPLRAKKVRGKRGPKKSCCAFFYNKVRMSPLPTALSSPLVFPTNFSHLLAPPSPPPFCQNWRRPHPHFPSPRLSRNKKGKEAN